MYQINCYENKNTGDQLQLPVRETVRAIIFVRNEFVISDILYVTDQCRELAEELDLPLEIAFFDEQGLNITFYIVENSIEHANMSLEQFDRVYNKMNKAMSRVFDGADDITWNIKVTSIKNYCNGKLDDLPF